MKKAQPHAMPPSDKSGLGYLAALPRKFFRVIKDIDEHAHHLSASSICDYLRAGDVVLQGGGAHQTKVRLATPTKATFHCLQGHGLLHEYQKQGFMRPLTLQELLDVIPHMTNRIWYLDGQYELRNNLCSLAIFPQMHEEYKDLLYKYWW